MTMIRKPRLVDLLNLQFCVNNGAGASDLPLGGPNIEDWARYSMVAHLRAEYPGKKIIAYVFAYTGYDDIWTNRVCGHVNKFSISPDYKDSDVIADLILTFEEIVKAEKNKEKGVLVVKRIKVDLPRSSRKTIDTLKEHGYVEDSAARLPDESMVQLRKGKKVNESEDGAPDIVEVFDVRPEAGVVAADIVEVINDHLPEAGVGPNVPPLTKSQKRARKKREAAEAEGRPSPSMVQMRKGKKGEEEEEEAANIVEVVDVIPEAGVGSADVVRGIYDYPLEAGVGAAHIVDAINDHLEAGVGATHIVDAINDHLEAAARGADGTIEPLTKSQKRARKRRASLNRRAAAVRVHDSGTVQDNSTSDKPAAAAVSEERGEISKGPNNANSLLKSDEKEQKEEEQQQQQQQQQQL